jgi:hypothetical protein
MVTHGMALLGLMQDPSADLKVQLDPKVTRATLVTLEQLDPKAILEILALREFKAYKVLKAIKVILEILVPKAFKVSKVLLALKVKLELRAFKASKDHKASKEKRVTKEIKVTLVILEQQALKVKAYRY